MMTPTGTSAETARRVAQRLIEAAESQDWTSFGELVHDDAVFEFVGRATLHGRDEIIEHDRSIHDGRMRHTTDLWTADDTGRVWWSFGVEWDDPETAEPRRTSGASTALVRDGAIASFTSWVDLSFMLPKA
jgi:ketosteroid isomerase-like protein